MNILVIGKYLRSDRILFYGCLCSFILFVVSTGIILITYPHLPPFIPLYNQLPWGEERLGKKIEFFTFPVMMGGVLLMNAIFAIYVYEKTPLLSRLFAVTSFLAGIFGLLFVIRTVELVL